MRRFDKALRPTRRGRIGEISGALALLGVLGLLVLPPTGAGNTGPLAKTTVTPPYSGKVTPSVTTVVTGCAHARAAIPPFFSLATGGSGTAGTANARTCTRSPTSEGLVEASYTAELLLPSHAGPTTVRAKGTYSVSASLGLTTGTCVLHPGRTHYAYCDRVSSISIYAYAYLLNRSSGRATYSSTYFPYLSNGSYNDTFCTGTGCSNSTSGSPGLTSVSLSGTFNWTFHPSTPFSAKVHYVLEIYLSASLAADCVAYNAVLRGCDAATSLNFASLGNGAAVTSIVLT